MIISVRWDICPTCIAAYLPIRDSYDRGDRPGAHPGVGELTDHGTARLHTEGAAAENAPTTTP